MPHRRSRQKKKREIEDVNDEDLFSFLDAEETPSTRWTKAVDSVPNEVLAQIFEHGVLIPTASHETLPFQQLIASVNRRWREVATSLPRLWSTVIFTCSAVTDHYFHLPRLWITRSAASLLDLTISVSRTSAQYASIRAAMSCILENLPRLKRLTVKTITHKMADIVIASLNTISVPRLQHFELAVRGSSSTDFDTTMIEPIFTEGASSLSFVSITGLVYSCQPPLAELAALELGGGLLEGGSMYLNYEELRGFLTSSPRLQSLTIHALRCVDSFEATIPIPSLRFLSVNLFYSDDTFVELFANLVLPILEVLSIAHMSKHHIQSFAELSEARMQLFPSLTTMKLFKCGPFFGSQTADLGNLPAFAAVNHLYLIDTNECVIGPYTLLPGNDPNLPWPNLKHLTVSTSSEETSIPDILKLRNGAGLPISNVVIPQRLLDYDASLFSSTSWSEIGKTVKVTTLDDRNSDDALKYNGLLDPVVYDDEPLYHPDSNDEYEDLDRYDDYGFGYGRRNRHNLYGDSDIDTDPEGPESELEEYWAVCGSD